MAFDKLSINDLLKGNVPGVPPPEDTPDDKHKDPHQPHRPCTPDPTMTKANRHVVGVDNSSRPGHIKATGLYNKHQKQSEQWNPCH
jgi:hypothetical protein